MSITSAAASCCFAASAAATPGGPPPITTILRAVLMPIFRFPVGWAKAPDGCFGVRAVWRAVPTRWMRIRSVSARGHGAAPRVGKSSNLGPRLCPPYGSLASCPQRRQHLLDIFVAAGDHEHLPIGTQ